MRDLGLLMLRLAMGGLLAGHGAQKLFGIFEGHGLEGTGRFMEKLGFQPGRRWAALAGMGEFGGGVLTALGFMHPVGPISTMGPMIVAWGRVHWGKPIWVTSGGAELPATYIGIALSLAMIGPGKLSLDRAFGLRPHPAIAILMGACVAGGALMALNQPAPEPEQQPEPQREAQQANSVAST